MTQNISPPAPPPLIRQSKTKCSCCNNNVSFSFHNKCIRCADINSVEFNYHITNIQKYIQRILDAGFKINDIDQTLQKYRIIS